MTGNDTYFDTLSTTASCVMATKHLFQPGSHTGYWSFVLECVQLAAMLNQNLNCSLTEAGPRSIPWLTKDCRKTEVKVVLDDLLSNNLRASTGKRSRSPAHPQEDDWWNRHHRDDPKGFLVKFACKCFSAPHRGNAIESPEKSANGRFWCPRPGRQQRCDSYRASTSRCPSPLHRLEKHDASNRRRWGMLDEESMGQYPSSVVPPEWLLEIGMTASRLPRVAWALKTDFGFHPAARDAQPVDTEPAKTEEDQRGRRALAMVRSACSGILNILAVVRTHEREGENWSVWGLERATSVRLASRSSLLSGPFHALSLFPHGWPPVTIKSAWERRCGFFVVEGLDAVHNMGNKSLIFLVGPIYNVKPGQFVSDEVVSGKAFSVAVEANSSSYNSFPDWRWSVFERYSRIHSGCCDLWVTCTK